jgi:hypothetical protein
LGIQWLLYFYLRPLCILFDVYMILIVAGIIASLDSYPHTIDGDRVTLRQGRLRSVTFARADVVETAIYGTEMSRNQLRAIAGRGVAYLLTTGAPTLRIRLREPAEVATVFGSKKAASVFYASVGDPRALRVALATPG